MQSIQRAKGGLIYGQIQVALENEQNSQKAVNQNLIFFFSF
jgi:hypothetical protein